MDEKPVKITLLFICVTLMLGVVSSHSAIAAPSWRIPLEKPFMVRDFVQPASAYAPGHRGIDYQVEPEELVFAPNSGLVSFSGRVVDRTVLSISHGNGLISSMEPVCPAKRLHESVNTGDLVGYVCADQTYPSHCAPKLCLHFSIRNQFGYLSPLFVLGRLAPSRLKPLGGLICNRNEAGQC